MYPATHRARAVHVAAAVAAAAAQNLMYKTKRVFLAHLPFDNPSLQMKRKNPRKKTVGRFAAGNPKKNPKTKNVGRFAAENPSQ